jgi:hypothetical protein
VGMLINAGLLLVAGYNSRGFNGRPFMIEYACNVIQKPFLGGGGEG